jgi:hypothetical protein
MLRRVASNAYSWWWASHIRNTQSKWLDNNLQGNTSQLPVRCDGSQQYPRKLSTKKISKFSIDYLRFPHNIFLI